MTQLPTFIPSRSNGFSPPLAIGTLLLLVSILAGCNGRPSNIDVSFVPPATIQEDQSQWVQVEWDSEIESKVANHFLKSPEVSDNPSLTGQTVCYVNGSRQRVYWLSPVNDTCHWAMVEFDGAQGGELMEGIGAPFVELQVSAP